jgi:hypothetical protein
MASLVGKTASDESFNKHEGFVVCELVDLKQFDCIVNVRLLTIS